MVGACVYNNAEEVFVRYRRTDVQDWSPPPIEPEGHRFVNDRLLLIHGMRFESNTVGTVFLESDMGALRDRRRQYLLILSVVVGFAVLFVLLLAWRLQTLISKPVLDLAELEHRVSTDKDYGVRATTTSKDEIGLLVDGFNAMLSEVERRDTFLRQTFGRYLSDEIVDGLLNSPDGLTLGGSHREVIILMSDLRGFTPFAERLAPAQLVEFLNHYLAIMTEVIGRHSGTIDEFIGDAILVIFGAPIERPDDSLRAAACAVEMQQAMSEVNEWNHNHGLPEVEMGTHGIQAQPPPSVHVDGADFEETNGGRVRASCDFRDEGRRIEEPRRSSRAS